MYRLNLFTKTFQRGDLKNATSGQRSNTAIFLGTTCGVETVRKNFIVRQPRSKLISLPEDWNKSKPKFNEANNWCKTR